MKHWAVYVDNNSNKNRFIKSLLKGQMNETFSELTGSKISLFSKNTIETLIDEEEKHGTKIITKQHAQDLKTMSSGEQKKALLEFLLKSDASCIILDNPFDNLDKSAQIKLMEQLSQKANQIHFIQLISRKRDVLHFMTDYFFLKDTLLEPIQNPDSFINNEASIVYKEKIPEPLHQTNYTNETLIDLKNVSVHFNKKPILNAINWKIKVGEFWQLIGKNGSGKTTLISMLTGENPKGYGQDIFLFGYKKGSGESIWDIKKYIGYFTPSMTDSFKGNHTIEHMLISGFNDSIGLYIKPSEAQVGLAKKWLALIGMWSIKDMLFSELSRGQQRLVMTARAMIKQPLLLILDEATAALDDASASLLVNLVNKISKESTTTILFVSHRDEPNLKPNAVFELKMTANGSRGVVV